MKANKIETHIKAQKAKIEKEELSLEEVIKEEIDKAYESGKHIGFVEGYLAGLLFLQTQIKEKQLQLADYVDSKAT